MSGYRLCRTDAAEKPYYIENIGLNVFSLEELCYYFVHDTALLDETIMNKTLTAWLDEELHLNQLARALEKLLADGKNLTDFVLTILREDGYLSHNEQQNFRALLTKMSGEPREVRLKKKADALVKCGKISGAIEVYRKILELPGLKADEVFKAAVSHNMGVAFIRLFKYREALECFEKALAFSYTGAYLKSYLYAYALCKPRGKYEEKLEEMGVDQKTRDEVEKELQEASHFKGEEPEDKDRYLEGLVKAYHKAADA